MFVRIRGRSMLPVLKSGDLIWCSKTTNHRRGQLLLIHKNELYVKRLVGLPGDHLALKNGALSINGAMTQEPYLSTLTHLQPFADQTWQLGAGEFFVLGDSRDDSLDSRTFGALHKNDIVGTLRFRLWPYPVNFGNLS